MLKKIIIIFNITLFILLNNELYSQKEGFVWCFGKKAGVDFNFSPPLKFYSNAFTFETAASISDKNGNLLFYVSQMIIGNNSPENQYACLFNRSHQKLKNSDSLKIFISATQGAIILPLPGSRSFFYLFHIGAYYDINNPQCGNTKKIRYYYSIIDITGDNGLGEVISKNNLLIDNWATEKMIAVRHGNGRDWWIIMHGINDNFYKLLFTPRGIDTIYYQNIGPDFNELIWNNCNILNNGQMSVSKTGSKIVLANSRPNRSVDLFDFNRCTGNICNWVNVIESLNEEFYGCAFSSNEKYLYASNELYPFQLYQFDITSNDISSSKVNISSGNIDGYFCQMKLAPDDKIYIAKRTNNYVQTLHIIHAPNGQGFACNFEPDALDLDSGFSSYSLPNIPNFNLGHLLGSPCDTLSIVQPEDPPEGFYTGVNEQGGGNSGFWVYPNPASSILYIDIESSDYMSAEFTLFNSLGQKVMVKTIEANTKSISIDISKLKTGFYNYAFNINNERIAFDKIIVIR